MPFASWVLPANFFDNTGYSTCLSQILFDVQCYACGLTRAFQHAMHLDFKIAWDYNHLIAVVFPLLIVYYFQQFSKSLKQLKNLPQSPFPNSMNLK